MSSLEGFISKRRRQCSRIVMQTPQRADAGGRLDALVNINTAAGYAVAVLPLPYPNQYWWWITE